MRRKCECEWECEWEWEYEWEWGWECEWECEYQIYGDIPMYTWLTFVQYYI